MRNRKLALLLTLAMIISMFPLNVFGTEFSDMPDNWSAKALESAVANGLLKGDNGKIMPNENLTRAQMATIVNRAFGTRDKVSIDSFTDVKKDAWYYDEMAKAVQMKTFIGSGDKLYPDNSITREEAFIVLARAFKLSGGNANVLDKFTDKNDISDWAREGISSLVAAGYISGSDGRINPKHNITRAEFAQVMYNLLKNYINEEGTYTEDYDGNVMINVPNVTLKGLTVTGDLIIGDGVGDGEVILDDVTVTGRVLVRGGGENSIKIIGNSNIKNIIIARVDGIVRIYAEDETEIGEVIADGYDDVIIEGSFESVTIVGSDITVNAVNATVESASIEGENSKIIIDEKSSVKTINVNANNAEISGKGTVESVTANANNVEVTVPGASVTAGEGTTGVTAGDKPVEPGKTEKVEEEKPPASTGGGGSSYKAVNAVSVDQDIMILKVGETETITAAISPSNATDVRVTWSSSDNNIATVDENGKITAMAGGKATITVTSVADSSKKATVQVVVGDILIPAIFADDPTLGTIQGEIDKAQPESTIVVMPTAYTAYNEQLVINKSLTLLGLNTKLNGSITITAHNVTVDGFIVEAPNDYTIQPVIHIIDSDNVNIINNTVIAQGYASIGTSSGPARVTGKISGNTVTGMIIAGTDGELEVSDNDITLTPTSTEGICFYPAETTAKITVINNKIGQVRDGFAQIKIENEPESVNGKTRDFDIIEAITEDNYGATALLSWATVYYVSTTGDDTNPGTQEAPFANIQKAVNEADDGDIIIVQEGSYNVWCPTTDPNNYTGRDHNLFIGKNIAIKGEGIVDIYSYQTVYKSTFDARIVVLISGSDGVVIKNLNIYPVYYPGTIINDLPLVTDSKINSITGQTSLKVYYNQIVDTLMVYNGGKPTSESTITNVTIKDCTIGDPDLAAEEWGSAIYFNGYNNNSPVGIKGGYTVEGNILYGSLTLCEDAGWDSESQDCIIQNNHFYGNLHFVGERPTGWNFKSMTVYPTVIGNTFYKANASITDIDGTTYNYFAGSRDINEDKLISRDQLEDIIENNFFKGDLDGKEIDIAIGRHNYSETDDEYHAIIYVKKVTPVVATAVETTAVTEGQTLADSELSGTFKVSADDGTAVAGTLAWDAPTTIVSETGEFAWTFTPTDRLTYNVVKGFVSVEVVHPQDINVSSTNSFYVQNPDVYKGVTTEFSFSGEDLNKIISIKVELFGENDVLIGTNTLKSEKLISGGGTLPVNNGALTSPFVVIQGSYTSGSWDTVWEEGKLNPDNPPVKAVLTAVDDNGAKYIAEDNDFNSFSGNGGTWESIWYIIEANGLVYSPDGLILLDASGWNEETNTINASDFRDGVAEIGFRAFDSLNVQSVVFPESVKIIGNAAFGDNLFIESVTFPSQLEKIGTWCFEGCKNLTTVSIPSTVTYIGDNAFKKCSNMDLSGDLPSGLTYLGSDVFQETDITSITIPNGITEIKEDTFYACHNLTSIEFAGNIISIGKNGIRETAITELVIPGSLTSIGDYALRDNKELTIVEFGGTVEEWNNVTKGTGYKLNVPDAEITCTDGTATL